MSTQPATQQNEAPGSTTHRQSPAARHMADVHSRRHQTKPPGHHKRRKKK